MFSRFEENLRPASRFWELWRSKMRFGQNVLRITWIKAFCTIFMKSALFSRFEENFRPVSRFWELWRSKMRFGQNVLRMTWKSVLYNFHEKRTVFPFWREFEPVSRFWELWRSKMRFGQNVPRMTWKSVLYNFHEKRAVFLFWREFAASFTILRTLTLKNAIWSKRAPHDMKRGFCTIFIKSALFSVLKRILGQFYDFENFDAQKCDLAKTCCAWPEKSVLYNFQRKRTVLPFCREFGASVTILRTLMLKNAIWAKRAPHELKRAFFTIVYEKRTLFPFSKRKRILRRPVSRFWERFWEIDAQKCDLAKTCSAWPENSVLYNFNEKRTVFAFWREFEASFTILRTLTLKNAIWPKRAAHDLKTAFCTIFIESALFSCFQEHLRPAWRFWKRWRSKMRFGQNVLRMTWKEGFVQFS